MLGRKCKVAEKNLKQLSKRTVSQVVTLGVEDKAEIKHYFVQCLARTEKCKETREVVHKNEGSQRAIESKITGDYITCGNRAPVDELRDLLNHHRKTVRKKNEKERSAEVRLREYKVTLEERTTPSLRKQFPIREDLRPKVRSRRFGLS